jgi:hypothetical protein
MLGTQCPNILYRTPPPRSGQLIVWRLPAVPDAADQSRRAVRREPRQRARIAQQGGDGLANAETAGKRKLPAA